MHVRHDEDGCVYTTQRASTYYVVGGTGGYIERFALIIELLHQRGDSSLIVTAFNQQSVHQPLQWYSRDYRGRRRRITSSGDAFRALNIHIFFSIGMSTGSTTQKHPVANTPRGRTVVRVAIESVRRRYCT